MAVTANMRLYVERPGAQVPRYGLFSVANGPLDLPVHARQGGLEYQSVVCDLPTGYEIECPPSEDEKSFSSGGANLITADPFVVRSDLECAPVGLTNEQLRRWLIERLKAGEQGTVERAFSDGLYGASPSLQGATDLAASASLLDAVGLLEDWLYSRYGLPGVNHVQLVAAQRFKVQIEPVLQGNAYRTALGTLVSFGNYSGIGPEAEEPTDGTTYLYITGQVTVWRAADSDVFATPLAAALDRTTNQVYGQAEREYAVAYECFAASTLVTL